MLCGHNIKDKNLRTRMIGVFTLRIYPHSGQYSLFEASHIHLHTHIIPRL